MGGGQWQGPVRSGQIRGDRERLNNRRAVGDNQLDLAAYISCTAQREGLRLCIVDGVDRRNGSQRYCQCWQDGSVGVYFEASRIAFSGVTLGIGADDFEGMVTLCDGCQLISRKRERPDSAHLGKRTDRKV